LDQLLMPFRNAPTALAPKGGWIRAIREALGVTNAQFADRLGMEWQSVADIQHAEATEAIKLKTLRKLARALGCELVYAVVPPRPLAELRAERAMAEADHIVQQLTHAVKPDATGGKVSERDLEKLIKQILNESRKPSK
jgi:predicted DNA-binding mobile mystery protein A